MKDGDLKKLIREAITAPVEEMCGVKKHKNLEEFDFDIDEPAEPNNPDYMRGWEDGHEAGKIGAAMYGESVHLESRSPKVSRPKKGKK